MSSTNQSDPNDVIIQFLKALPQDQRDEILKGMGANAQPAPAANDPIADLRRKFSPEQLRLQLGIVRKELPASAAIPGLVGFTDEQQLEAALNTPPIPAASSRWSRSARNRPTNSPRTTRPLSMSAGKRRLLTAVVAWGLSVLFGLIVITNTIGRIDSTPLNHATGAAHALLTFVYFVIGWFAAAVVSRVIGKLIKKGADVVIPYFRTL